MAQELDPLHAELLSALQGMFALHEPEGRFQPSHYKPVLAKARAAIAKATEAQPADVMQDLRDRWHAGEEAGRAC